MTRFSCYSLNFRKSFSRFTPDALRLLSKKFSEIIEFDGWDNFEAGYSFAKARGPGNTARPLALCEQARYDTNPLRPIVTWIMTRK